MPRGKRLTESLVKRMAKAADKGLTYADIGRKFGINPDTASIHVRALKEGLWTPDGIAKQTAPVQASARKVRAYQKAGAPPVDFNLTKEEKGASLYRAQAKSAVKDLQACRRAAATLATENVELRMTCYKLRDEIKELRGE